MSLQPARRFRHVTEPATAVEPALGGPSTARSESEVLVAALVDASVAPATRRAYAADWARFAAWCEPRGVDALAADETTVAAYVAQASALVDAMGDPVASRWTC